MLTVEEKRVDGKNEGKTASSTLCISHLIHSTCVMHLNLSFFLFVPRPNTVDDEKEKQENLSRKPNRGEIWATTSFFANDVSLQHKPMEIIVAGIKKKCILEIRTLSVIISVCHRTVRDDDDDEGLDRGATDNDQSVVETVEIRYGRNNKERKKQHKKWYRTAKNN